MKYSELNVVQLKKINTIKKRIAIFSTNIFVNSNALFYLEEFFTQIDILLSFYYQF